MPLPTTGKLSALKIDKNRARLVQNILADTTKKKHVFGLGAFGGNLALIHFLAKSGHEVVVWEARPQKELAESWNSLAGVHQHIQMNWGVTKPVTSKSDIIFTTPALPPTHAWLAGHPQHLLFTEIEVSLFLLAGRNTLVHTIIGSVGKSTCASLMSDALQCPLYGNIGRSPLRHIATIDREIILELSSYQLVYLKPLQFVPSSYFVTPIADNHQKWHGGLKQYQQAKLEWVEVWKNEIPGTNMNEPVTEKYISAITLMGPHNMANANAVLAHIAKFRDLTPAMLENIRLFKGLSHRLEVIGKVGDCRIINDSKATSPVAVLTALECVRPGSTLILQGCSEEFDYVPLFNKAAELGLEVVCIAYPEQRLPSKADYPQLRVQAYTNLNDAFAAGAITPHQGRDILFSPGAPSYGQYLNYEQRGEDFKGMAQRHLPMGG